MVLVDVRLVHVYKTLWTWQGHASCWYEKHYSIQAYQSTQPNTYDLLNNLPCCHYTPSRILYAAAFAGAAARRLRIALRMQSERRNTARTKTMAKTNITPAFFAGHLAVRLNRMSRWTSVAYSMAATSLSACGMRRRWLT
jgi:hypothetical protein